MKDKCYLDDSLESFCQVSFFRNFSTDRPPVYLQPNKCSSLFPVFVLLPCYPPGGEDMVRSTSLVTMGHSGALTKEKRAIVREVCVVIIQVRGQDLKMFRSVAVTNTNCFFTTWNNNNFYTRYTTSKCNYSKWWC